MGRLQHFQLVWSSPSLSSLSPPSLLLGRPLRFFHPSESAVLQMARSMACELGKHKIRVNSISPGYVFLLVPALLLSSAFASVLETLL
jgi:NAD(P)-dependent dehydrogenase (short-subunit alcohol dehydrogenase family)